MKLSKTADVLINVVIPIALGAVAYYYSNSLFKISLLKNHLADGLWAYACFSSILIIWNRKINIFWLLVALLSSFLFEFLQYKRLISGTGDLIDGITYLIFFILALYSNNLFKSKATKN
jgi:hypothetical protein